MSLNGILVLVSIWAGVIIFFSAIIAPTVFKTLDEKSAGVFLRAFFPKYYLFGFVLSFSGIILSTFEKSNISLLVFSFIMLGFLFSRQILMPMINKAKDENNDNKFNKLHKFSVFINFVQIIASVFLLVMYLK